VVPAVYDPPLRIAGSEILAAVEDAHADWQHLRDQLVDGLRQAGHVSSRRVAAALRTVPGELRLWTVGRRRSDSSYESIRTAG
jgi:hypothetical protein